MSENGFDLNDLFTQPVAEVSPPVVTQTPIVAEVVAVAEPKPRRGRPAKATTRDYLYLDFETIPDESRIAQFGLPPVGDPPPVTAEDQLLHPKEFISQGLDECRKYLDIKRPCPSWLAEVEQLERSGTKPRKGIADALDSHRGRLDACLAAADQRRKLLSVTPEFCRIVAAGTAIGDAPPTAMVVGVGELTEEDILHHVWDLIATSNQIIGYNILGFDLPALFVRSALLGIPATRRLDLKPWGADCVDLMAVRWPRSGAMKLKDLAGHLGFDVPAGDCDGSRVVDLWQNDKAKLAEYVQSDILITQRLHKFYRGYFC